MEILYRIKRTWEGGSAGFSMKLTYHGKIHFEYRINKKVVATGTTRVINLKKIKIPMAWVNKHTPKGIAVAGKIDDFRLIENKELWRVRKLSREYGVEADIIAAAATLSGHSPLEIVNIQRGLPDWNVIVTFIDGSSWELAKHADVEARISKGRARVETEIKIKETSVGLKVVSWTGVGDEIKDKADELGVPEKKVIELARISRFDPRHFRIETEEYDDGYENIYETYVTDGVERVLVRKSTLVY